MNSKITKISVTVGSAAELQLPDGSTVSATAQVYQFKPDWDLSDDNCWRLDVWVRNNDPQTPRFGNTFELLLRIQDVRTEGGVWNRRLILEARGGKVSYPELCFLRLHIGDRRNPAILIKASWEGAAAHLVSHWIVSEAATHEIVVPVNYYDTSGLAAETIEWSRRT